MTDVVSERRGEVAWIRLNRADRMNAYDQAMADELIHAIRDAADAGVIVITGTDKAFCAGGFLANLQDPDPAELRGMFYNSLRFTDEIRNSPRPVIAAVNGAAAGGGNELVVACDLAIASDRATFGQTGPKVGSAPVLGGTNLLAAQSRGKSPKEVSFLCRRYDAATAAEWGWNNDPVPHDELEDAVTRWADDLLANSPRYLEIAKVSSNLWWNASRDNMLQGLGMLVQAIGSDDMVEGASAFMQKRRPQWPGREPRN